MGKGAGKGGRAMAVGEEAEVLIEGQLYDVSSFRHPGGSIVKFLTGQGDATDAFHQFHRRSAKATKMLKALPHRPADDKVMAARGFNGQEALAKDFTDLTAQLAKEGYFDPVPVEIGYRCLEVAAMHVLGVYLMTSTSFWYSGVVLLGIASGRCGWLMHEGGHYSLTGQIKIDKLLQEFIYGFGCGMSAAWWRNQHNKHHATPQKLQHDVDLDTLPLVAFHAKVASKAKNPMMKAWLKLQGALFIPVSCLLVALGWQIYLHPRHVARIKNPYEAAFMALRYVAAAALLKDLSLASAVGTFLLYDHIAASYIFTNFSLSHTHLPVTNPDEYLHWVEYAAKHTTNISPGPICNWWMANLNFQIEHHLFPSMPQCNHKVISPRIKAFFEKHGLVYDVRPYFSCLGQTLLNLHHVGNDAQAKAKNA